MNSPFNTANVLIKAENRPGEGAFKEFLEELIVTTLSAAFQCTFINRLKNKWRTSANEALKAQWVEKLKVENNTNILIQSYNATRKWLDFCMNM